MKSIIQQTRLLVAIFAFLFLATFTTISKAEDGGGIWGLFGYVDCSSYFQVENCSPYMSSVTCGSCTTQTGCNATQWGHCRRKSQID